VRRREALEREITALLPGSPWQVHVGRLRCRGIDTLTAVGLCAEIGDFERFARPGQLMSYVGLVPSEATTGDKRRLGAITKTGSGHARRLLVEAPGTTASDPLSAARCMIAKTASPPKLSRSRGPRSGACIAPGRGWRRAASAARSSPSPREMDGLA
jgi:transposase